jgi:hypothetical protein
MADVFMPLTWLAVLPALFDAVENVLLIKFLYADAATVSDTAYSVYYWCVHIKFTMLIVAVLTVLALVLQILYAKLVGRKA